MTFNCSVVHVSPQYSKISQFPMLLSGTVNLSSYPINCRRKWQHLENVLKRRWCVLLCLPSPPIPSCWWDCGYNSWCSSNNFGPWSDHENGNCFWWRNKTEEAWNPTIMQLHVNSQLPSARLKKLPLLLFCVSYPSSQKLILTKTGWLSTISR